MHQADHMAVTNCQNLRHMHKIMYLFKYQADHMADLCKDKTVTMANCQSLRHVYKMMNLFTSIR